MSTVNEFHFDALLFRDDMSGSAFHGIYNSETAKHSKCDETEQE